MGFEIPAETISIEVHDKVYELKLTKVGKKLIIDPNQIDEALEQQAAFFFWVATLASYAEHNAEVIKQELDILLSETQKELRMKMESDGGKAPAATTVEAAAKSTKDYQEAAAQLLEARETAAIMSTVREAVRMRQYLLIERSRRASKLEAAETEE